MLFLKHQRSEQAKLHPGIKLVVFFLFFSGIILLGNMFRNEEKLKLNDSVKTKAVVSSIASNKMFKINGGSLTFMAKQKQVKVKVYGDWSKLNVGDSVEIRYSKSDPTIIKVINKYYERKKEIIKNL